MGTFQIVTGPGTQCFVNDMLVGEVSSFSFDANKARRPIYALDSTEPYELAATTTKVSGSVSMYRKVGMGGLEGYGASSSFEETPRELYVSIRLVSRQTGLPLFECKDACIISQRWEVGERSLMRGSFSFEGITWHNEIK